jgi:pyruvate formate-lyase/glycerol dehydratase family glycyl radical enzyme
LTRESRIETLKENLDHAVHAPKEAARSTILTDPGILDEPLQIRKAKAFALFLREAPVHIYPEELIVGIPFMEKPLAEGAEGHSLRSLPPESPSGQGYIDGAHRRISLGLSELPFEPVIQALEGYGASSRHGLFPYYATEEEKAEARRMGLDENSNPGHLQAGFARVVRHGWSGLKEMAEAGLEETDASTSLGEKRAIFLRSVILALEGAQAFAARYADLADEMAKGEDNPRRRLELREISQICLRLTREPPRTFREALQILWFTHIVNNTQGARQLGRFDQYVYPFLERDLEAGRLTMEGAQEFLDCLWIKFAMVTDVTADNLQNLILGGQTPDGKDATNPLSYMCLDSTDRLGLIDPKVSLRIHRDTPDDFLRKACEIVIKGEYQPGIYNDEAVIPALVDTGIPLEDARDYTNDGCSELLVQGKTNPWAFEANVKLLKCVERVTARIEEFEAFDDLMAALKEEISLAVEMAVANTNLLQAAVPRISPNPFLSASVGGCIEKALDLTEGGAVYNSSAVCASGVADTADSLAALKKLVFEERAVGKRELLEALEVDFEGSERLRQMLLNRAPKFGNDIEYVDALAAEIVEHTAVEVSKHRNPRGGRYNLGLFSYGNYISHGIVTGATPDGRKAGKGIAPNFSPAPGRDTKGPFAVFKSTTRVDQKLAPNGTALDLALHPSALRGPEGAEKLMALIKAYVELGGMQVQFNIVDSDVLRAAQMEPEKYRNLTVRLWGFPAYFVRLPREFQDHLIARTDHGL